MFYFWNTGQRRLKKERKKKNRETKNKRCFCFVKFSVARAAESTQSTNNYILSNSRLRSESGFILVIFIFIIFIYILSEFILLHSKWQRIFDILWFESKWKRDSKQKNVNGRVWVKSRFAETCASGYFCFEENKVCHA